MKHYHVLKDGLLRIHSIDFFNVQFMRGKMTTKILILGANGFIGSHLVESILSNTDFEVVGVDKGYHNIKSLVNHSRFTLIKKILMCRTTYFANW